MECLQVARYTTSPNNKTTPLATRFVQTLRISDQMSNVRRSQTLRNTRSSMPGGSVTSKATALDDLGVLHEEGSTVPSNIEAQLRSEIFERERANDKVRTP